MSVFSDPKQLNIQNGQIDLRDWNAQDGGILSLDGEWEFYPSQWLFEDQPTSASHPQPSTYIQVPGKWDDALHPNLSTPYGFASYRLLLYVNPNEKTNYSIRISNVYSASEIYVNGRLLAKSGQVGKTKEAYLARDLPYSATFTADENGVIDIVIQVANYKDARGGGIVRSIHFGSAEAIAKEITLSSYMQLLSVFFFSLHSVYAFILFWLGSIWFGNRNRKLLYFSLFTGCMALLFLLSTDEKLLHQFVYIDYDWDFRIMNAAFLIGTLSLLSCTDHRQLPVWRDVYPTYLAITLGTAVITLGLPARYVITLHPFYNVLLAISMLVIVIVTLSRIKQNVPNQLLMLLSCLAFVHHFLWWSGWREFGVSVVHYPFDIIIASVILASLLFKEYFRIHAETKELAATLQRMNENKDRFLANTSHEFRSPLHVILNLSQLVLERERAVLQQRSVKELETILSVGHRMTLLLNDLIDVTSLREGNPRLQKKPVLVQSIVTGVLDMLQLYLEVKPITVVKQIPADFPPVLADEHRMIQVVFNLLHNAVKFTQEGEIVIRAVANNGKAIISISDTGIGIDQDMLERIFHPYEQADPKKTMLEGGFGLGLSICKQLVELHGGTLEVSSVVGKGSTFTFSLDLAEQEAVAQNLGKRPYAALLPEKGNGSESLKPIPVSKRKTEKKAAQASVLIVDDDPANLQVLEAILSLDDYAITSVTSGKEALEQLDAKEWDLVISDVMMPNMSGYALTRIIRNRLTPTELPILLLTARNHLADIKSGFAAGANDYVTKPAEPFELRSRTQALIALKRTVQERLHLEAAWLQAQIQPHFIFNTLNTIIALSEIELQRMRDLLHTFSDFLRMKFQFRNMGELIPVEDELNTVRSYLLIEQARYEDRLRVIWEVADCADFRIPFLTIQPLVENAIQHGIMQRYGGGMIVIQIVQDGPYLEVTVEDDGVGMDEHTLQQVLAKKASPSSGVGLINTDLRLKRYFGTGLRIQSTPGAGTKVSFTVKKIREG